MIPVDKYPALVAAEDALVAELERQHLAGEIRPSTAFQDAFFEGLDGELVGSANWALVVHRVVEAWEAMK